MRSGLADITLESRKELNETITKLANIVLKKVNSKTQTLIEENENPEDNRKTAPASS
jgi:hypothetical protein